MPSKRQPNSFANSAPLFLIAGGLVIIISILLWQALSSTPQGNSVSPTTDLNIPYSNIQRVSIADAKAAFDQKSAVFVDVRDTEVYDSNHIQGAISIPLEVFNAQYSQLDPNQWIITYCT